MLHYTPSRCSAFNCHHAIVFLLYCLILFVAILSFLSFVSFFFFFFGKEGKKWRIIHERAQQILKYIIMNMGV
mgnify:CR=1 FL=1